MNISEVRMEKVNLEKCIAGLLVEFEAKTHVAITNVRVLTLDDKNIFQDSRHEVSIRIVL